MLIPVTGVGIVRLCPPHETKRKAEILDGETNGSQETTQDTQG